MQALVTWLEAHDKLAGWAQFFGAIIALALTYFTAFAPHWHRRKQLRKAAERLLAHGYEALESFHRTSAYFLPMAINIRAASLMIRSVISEMNRFPIYDLDDQGSFSLARRLVAVSATLEGACLMLDDTADRMGDQKMSAADRDFTREWIGERLEAVTALVAGIPLKRPHPSDFFRASGPNLYSDVPVGTARCTHYAKMGIRPPKTLRAWLLLAIIERRADRHRCLCPRCITARTLIFDRLLIMQSYTLHTGNVGAPFHAGFAPLRRQLAGIGT
ncbi:hypothetical protein [Sphingomonas crocodyli]|uniref:hypothetical protein n=1 Tax=Sphingomonas crocodyli TaxID=1979270 RepID=UPI0019D2D7C6|nr:hypothetical protein [Sphingomonas crocodyli]